MSLFLSERCVCTCLWSPYIKQIILTGKQRRTRWRDNRMNWRNPFSKLVLSIFSKQMSRIISSNASRDFQEHQRCVFDGIVQSWICWYKDSMVLKWCFEITEILSYKLWTIKVDIHTISISMRINSYNILITIICPNYSGLLRRHNRTEMRVSWGKGERLACCFACSHTCVKQVE